MPLLNNVTSVNCGRGKTAASVLLVIGLIAMMPAVALAHAYLDHADPAPRSTLAQAPSALRSRGDSQSVAAREESSRQ